MGRGWTGFEEVDSEDSARIAGIERRGLGGMEGDWLGGFANSGGKRERVGLVSRSASPYG